MQLAFTKIKSKTLEIKNRSENKSSRDEDFEMGPANLLLKKKVTKDPPIGKYFTF